MARRRATALLVVVAAVFVAVTAAGADDGWAPWVRAAAEGSLVGGIADWFAVTAIFRRPLGLPIPHTAVIPERKDQFGRVLGDFVQDELLTPSAISERVRAYGVITRLTEWTARPANAAVVAGHMADAMSAVADALRDEDVHQMIEEAVLRRVEATPLAPLAGRVLDVVTAHDRHHQVLDVALVSVDRFLRENHDRLRDRFGHESPWWLPGVVDRRIFQNLFDGVRTVLREVADDPTHELRTQFDRRIRGLAGELQSSPELRARGEALKHELLGQTELRSWSASVWTDLKLALRAQADDPGSELRQRLADALRSAASRVQDDPVLVAKGERAVVAGAGYLADRFHDEIAGLVVTTVERWDAQEASGKLELLLGRDLQFIRINGTVVGGIAGLAIHALGLLL